MHLTRLNFSKTQVALSSSLSQTHPKSDLSSDNNEIHSSSKSIAREVGLRNRSKSMIRAAKPVVANMYMRQIHCSWAVFVVDDVIVYFPLSFFVVFMLLASAHTYIYLTLPHIFLPCYLTSYLTLPHILPFVTLPYVLPFVILPVLPYLTSYLTIPVNVVYIRCRYVAVAYRRRRCVEGSGGRQYGRGKGWHIG